MAFLPTPPITFLASSLSFFFCLSFFSKFSCHPFIPFHPLHIYKDYTYNIHASRVATTALSMASHSSELTTKVDYIATVAAPAVPPTVFPLVAAMGNQGNHCRVRCGGYTSPCSAMCRAVRGVFFDTLWWQHNREMRRKKKMSWVTVILYRPPFVNRTN